MDSIGPYRVLRKLGQGGMAAVFEAVDSRTGRRVAVKLLPELLTGDDFRARFEREAQLVAALRHPNLLPVLDSGSEAGVSYIVEELALGGTLADLPLPLSLARAAELLEPIASALDHAHAHGILHRDVKPANILLRGDGTPLLADFGLAKVLDSNEHVTRTGMIVGTPDYMAPEQCEGRPLTGAADVYSLAATAYELLTGRPPFTGENPLAVVLAHVRQPVPSPRQFNPALTPAVEAALLRGLAKAPAARFAIASDLVLALRAGPPLHDARRLQVASRVLGSAAAAVAALALVLLPAGSAQAPDQAGRAAVHSLSDFQASLPSVVESFASGGALAIPDPALGAAAMVHLLVTPPPLPSPAGAVVPTPNPAPVLGTGKEVAEHGRGERLDRDRARRDP